MADVTWPLGTDSSEYLRAALRDYLKAKLAANKPQLPRRHHHIILDGERQRPGVLVVISTQPDEEQAWPYMKSGKRVLEERHGIAITVKADAKNGGSESVLKTFGFIRALLNTDSEHAVLRALGVQNLHETTDGLVGASGEAAESIEFRRQLSLGATTEIFLT